MNVDLIIKNVRLYNSYFKKFVNGDVAIYNGKFVHIGKGYEDRLFPGKVVEGNGQFMIPGLIDIHMHIESSMTIPSEFSKAVVKHGVTTVVADPHEIANVFGIEGIEAFVKEEEKIDIFYGIPSSVPSTSKHLETTGGTIGEDQVNSLLNNPKILCLGEVMNFKDLIEDDSSQINNIINNVRERKHNFPLEGHCPKISGVDLSLYIYRGVDGDHTQQSVQSIEEKIAKGMFLEIQHKSMTEENMDFIINNNLYEHFALVTDDVMADKINHGHLNLLLKKAVDMGMSVENAIYVSTFTPARRMGMLDRGAIAPGKIADFILVDNLDEFNITTVYKHGEKVYCNEDGLNSQYFSNKSNMPKEFYNSIKLDKLTAEDFKVKYDGKNAICRTMKVSNGTTFTEEGEIALKVTNGEISWQGEDCALIAVFERYGKTGAKAFGLVQGNIIKVGAVATTWAHDHHNLMVMGRNIDDMVKVANNVISINGGYSVCKEGEILAEAPLPIGGIVSDAPIEELGSDLSNVREAMKKLGYDHNNEIMSFSTLSLPVSPAIKITDKGLIDVRKQCIVPLVKDI